MKIKQILINYFGLDKIEKRYEERIEYLELQTKNRDDRLEARIDQLLRDLQDPNALTQLRYFRIGNPYITHK